MNGKEDSFHITANVRKAVASLNERFGARALPRAARPLPFDMSGSMGSSTPTHLGKTDVAEAFARAIGKKGILILDADDMKMDGGLDKLMGPPGGYKGFDDGFLSKVIDDLPGNIDQKIFILTSNIGEEGQQEMDVIISRRNGEALATECREGIAQASSPMKVIRLRNTQNSFAVAGRLWI